MRITKQNALETILRGGVEPYESPTCSGADIVSSGFLCQSVLADPEITLGSDLELGYGSDL